MRSQKKQRKKVPKREDSYCHAQQWPRDDEKSGDGIRNIIINSGMKFILVG